jgi:hypothetical protein
MKKLTYLVVLMLSLVTVFTSCEKDYGDDPIVPDQITVQDLVGNWNFESLTFNGTIYDTPSELDVLDVTYSYIKLSFVDVTTTEMSLVDHRGSNTPAPDNYTLSNNQINFREGFLVFSIENSETFDGTVLKLKLLSSTIATEKPIGGIYTLTHSN